MSLSNELKKRIRSGIRKAVLFDVNAERDKQEEKWGEQHLPDGTYGDSLSARKANLFRDRCNSATEDGTLTWRDILLEEVYEALAESDPVKLRNELVQSAAVLVAWIEDIDARP